jgi:multicomponent K+:H+ antiporter subunit G
VSMATEGSAVWGFVTAAFLVFGGGLTLIGSLGLLRLRSFYERVHAPTLGTTLGTTFIIIASMIHFSTVGERFVIHELLIVVFVSATTPITLMVLISAARFRDKFENATRNDDTTS